MLVPFSKYLYVVEPRYKSPIAMIFFVFVFDAVLCLLPIFNTTAFAAITGITTIGFQISYAIPIFFRLTSSRKSFRQNPAFNLGIYSEIIGWISFLWLTITSCIFFFPTQFDENMQQNATIFNYTCVVVGGTLFIALLYWFAPKQLGGARHHFVGPRRKEHEEETIQPLSIHSPLSDAEKR
jgi:amino acid transporter